MRLSTFYINQIGSVSKFNRCWVVFRNWFNWMWCRDNVNGTFNLLASVLYILLLWLPTMNRQLMCDCGWMAYKKLSHICLYRYIKCHNHMTVCCVHFNIVTKASTNNHLVSDDWTTQSTVLDQISMGTITVSVCVYINVSGFTPPLFSHATDLVMSAFIFQHDFPAQNFECSVELW